MKYITLEEIIDDILLLVRNSNISESEDLSRALIGAWVNHYYKYFWKLRKDELKDRIKQLNPSPIELLSLLDEEFFTVKEVELKLQPWPNENGTMKDGTFSYTKLSTTTLEDILNDSQYSILAIHDADGENILYMDHVRRHYHNYRKYTFGEVTAYYMPTDKHIYVQGILDLNTLKYVYVLAAYEKDSADSDSDIDDDDADEKDIKIPTWLVPRIKDGIMKNELAFMLNRPSDDSNNATLASVKPNGPQDLEE